MSVYSTLFYIGGLPSGGGTLYTVPPANTVVIRDMEVINNGASPATFQIYCQASGHSSALWQLTNLAASEWVQWAGRAVIPGGGVLEGYANSGTLTAMISGYLLG